jgi:hypothetical protein
MVEALASAQIHVSLRLPPRQRLEPSRQAKLQVVRELLATLDTATIPGQHYLMDRVIGLLGQEVSHASGCMTDWQRQSMTSAHAELVRQAARLVPDEATFRARAELLTDVLRLAS